MIQRLIAQGVLLAMLTGMLAPLASATAMPRACCLRRQQHCHMPHDGGFSSRSCAHQCCRFLAVSTALFTPVATSAHGLLPASLLMSVERRASQPSRARAEPSERAPPTAA